tara:strand:+ start:38189 stop:38404 length:216 start_codon:yes stop_codon:yes gene_type:complete
MPNSPRQNGRIFGVALDPLGRSTPHLINLIESLIEKKIGFKSIQDGAIDTTTALGELMFNIFSALSQLTAG